MLIDVVEGWGWGLGVRDYGDWDGEFWGRGGLVERDTQAVAAGGVGG